jgi:hypothetical protein
MLGIVTPDSAARRHSHAAAGVRSDRVNKADPRDVGTSMSHWLAGSTGIALVVSVERQRVKVERQRVKDDTFAHRTMKPSSPDSRGPWSGATAGSESHTVPQRLLRNPNTRIHRVRPVGRAIREGTLPGSTSGSFIYVGRSSHEYPSHDRRMRAVLPKQVAHIQVFRTGSVSELLAGT